MNSVICLKGTIEYKVNFPMSTMREEKERTTFKRFYRLKNIFKKILKNFSVN